MELKSTPFQMGYVLSVTRDHMLKSINISISKSFSRLKDFPENDTNLASKRQEIFETIRVLHVMREMIEGFEENNQHLFENKGE